MQILGYIQNQLAHLQNLQNELEALKSLVLNPGLWLDGPSQPGPVLGDKWMTKPWPVDLPSAQPNWEAVNGMQNACLARNLKLGNFLLYWSEENCWQPAQYVSSLKKATKVNPIEFLSLDAFIAKKQADGNLVGVSLEPREVVLKFKSASEMIDFGCSPASMKITIQPKEETK